LEGIIAGAVWLLGTALCLVISMLIVVAEGGDPMQHFGNMLNAYDSFDAYSLEGAILYLGSVSCLLLGIAIATKWVKLRSFNTVASSCGGFSFKIFTKVMLAALGIIGIPVAIDVFINADAKGPVEFTVLGFIACIILGPLQCCGEEFMFRGVVLQAIGSWVKIPILAIVVQTLLFVLGHPYGIYGRIEVAAAGLIMGYMVYYTRGLEASCAAHIANNMMLFILNGFGFKTISSDGGQLKDVIMVVVVNGLYLAFLIFMDKKYKWFERTELN
jgi:membrane protease YdiL (CAAX protease family)